MRNLFIGFLKRYGSIRAKRAIWNKELAAAEDPENTDSMTRLIEKYAANGPILDLGCGIGYLGEFVDATKYSIYTGVDISVASIEDAKKRRKSPKLNFVSSEIETYIPEGQFNVIAFKDSIYYIPFLKLTKVLKRYKRHLSNQGVFIVRIADGKRYANIVRLIESNFNLLERYQPGADIVLLVFN